MPFPQNTSEELFLFFNYLFFNYLYFLLLLLLGKKTILRKRRKKLPQDVLQKSLSSTHAASQQENINADELFQ